MSGIVLTVSEIVLILSDGRDCFNLSEIVLTESEIVLTVSEIILIAADIVLTHSP